MPVAPLDYTIRLIAQNDNCKLFKSGSAQFAPLKTFLQRQAIDFHAAGIAKTYVAVISADKDKPDIVIGFIALSCSEIDIRNGYTLEDCPHANRYETLPAVKIVRLAVDERYRGFGVGENLVALSIAIVNDLIVPDIGCRFLIADAKREAVNFYLRQGFTLLDTETNRGHQTPVMFIDLLTLE